MTNIGRLASVSSTWCSTSYAFSNKNKKPNSILYGKLVAACKVKSFKIKHKNCNAKRSTIISETSDFKLAFNAYRENLSRKYGTQSESESSSYRIHNWYRTTNMSPPVIATHDKELQIILSKLTNLEIGMSKLSIENVDRIEGIVQLGNRIGILARVETDVGENVTTSDSEDFDGIESGNRGIRVNIGGNALNRTNRASIFQTI